MYRLTRGAISVNTKYIQYERFNIFCFYIKKVQDTE